MAKREREALINCAGETQPCPTCGRLPCVASAQTGDPLAATDGDLHRKVLCLHCRTEHPYLNSDQGREEAWRWMESHERTCPANPFRQAVAELLPLVLRYRDAIETAKGEAVADAETRPAIDAAAKALGTTSEKLLDGGEV